jgi:hypothetical protein
MEPLILKFKERPTAERPDFSIVEYSDEQNLLILKATGKPAIEYLDLGTETFTKSKGEGADSDRSAENYILDSVINTSTSTRTKEETSDTDFGYVENLKMLFDTTTITEAVEGTDKDR